MNQTSNDHWSVKIRTIANAIFRYGPLVILSGSILYVALHDPYYRQTVSWTVARHWLALVSLAAVVLTALLFAITVGVFAFNADWHTRDGFAALLRCLFFEAVVIGVIAGLVWLVVTVLPLG
ncbi:MAG: hypothetical protein WCH99_07400 [Verrucomicrobiota bacterium]